ncbi:hypothetical protein ACFFWE_26925 [Sphaerisporangium melleum]|uniref:Uncharacterized protein n=1 Tax=Sphaerisporangium melleum TaxID=321316 RepID=A0A917QTC6_9ACTN|nr:hypothetical protein [Sphaerisporangium melleum]GGK66669.1 hypothetical protein GCM10007964_07120 [Sphaerisporangium melleum]
MSGHARIEAPLGVEYGLGLDSLVKTLGRWMVENGDEVLDAWESAARTLRITDERDEPHFPWLSAALSPGD